MANLPILANNPYMQRAREYLGALSSRRDAEAHMKALGERDERINELEAEIKQERKERKQETEAYAEIIKRLEDGKLLVGIQDPSIKL